MAKDEKREREIDPQLPYIQVSRGSAAQAAQLAPALGLSYQHTRGALLILWESLADRRLLAEALAKKKAIILEPAELKTRLSMAFGKEIDPGLLVIAGFLEPLEGGAHRVRGMSRALGTEGARLGQKGPKATPPKRTKTPTQAPLLDVEPTPSPPKPPREKSAAFKLHDDWNAQRYSKLVGLGLAVDADGNDIDPDDLDEKGLAPAWIAAFWTGALAKCDGQDWRVSRLMERFLLEDWPAKDPKRPPYGLGAFAYAFDKTLAAQVAADAVPM